MPDSQASDSDSDSRLNSGLRLGPDPGSGSDLGFDLLAVKKLEPGYWLYGYHPCEHQRHCC